MVFFCSLLFLHEADAHLLFEMGTGPSLHLHVSQNSIQQFLSFNPQEKGVFLSHDEQHLRKHLVQISAYFSPLLMKF